MKSNSFRNTIKTLLLLALFMFGSTGCNDWIDIEPENELIKQEFWKTSDDVLAVLAGTYDALRGTTQKSFLMGEVRADYLSVGGGTFNNYASIGANDIGTTNGETRWADYYKTINLANTVMYYAPVMQELDLSLTDRMLDGIESEMLFVRSLSYFYLLRIWKDVPLVLTPTISDTVDFYMPKSTEKEVIKQIKSDLKRASGKAWTQEFIGDRASYKGRANKYAIQSLLADVLLWNEEYEECITYCDSIIDTGIFALESNSDWFDLYYPGNSYVESIFEIQYDDDLEQQENPMFSNGLLGSLQINLSLIPYEEDEDIRYCNGNGPLWKYAGRDETGLGSRQRRSSERDANFIYYRYADILMMKAEALGETGNLTDGNYLVQQIADRAGVEFNPQFTLLGFRGLILTERGLEFAGEGKRWFDVLRFAKKEGFKDTKVLADIILGKASDAKELAIMRTKVIDTMSYYLPIHHDEVQNNRNLVQNPFYDR
jgi:starch-binding outer membrane protein, SusD/RagB family